MPGPGNPSYGLFTNKVVSTSVINGGASKKPGQPYILDLVTLEVLYFQNIPKDLKYHPEASWLVVASASRNNPNFQYLGGDDNLSFTLSWYSDDKSSQDVIKAMKWIEALSRNDGYNSKPHPIQCVWGNMYRDAKWIVHSAGPSNMSMFDRTNGMFPRLATQEIVLKRVVETNRSLSDIRSIYQ